MSKENYLDESSARKFPVAEHGQLIGELISIRTKLYLISNFSRIVITDDQRNTLSLLSSTLTRLDVLIPQILALLAD